MSRPTSICPHGHAKLPKEPCRECRKIQSKAWREKNKGKRRPALSWEPDPFGWIRRRARV